MKMIKPNLILLALLSSLYGATAFAGATNTGDNTSAQPGQGSSTTTTPADGTGTSTGVGTEMSVPGVTVNGSVENNTGTTASPTTSPSGKPPAGANNPNARDKNCMPDSTGRVSKNCDKKRY